MFILHACACIMHVMLASYIIIILMAEESADSIGEGGAYITIGMST